MALAGIVTFFLALYFLKPFKEGDSRLGSIVLGVCSLWILFYVFEMGFNALGIKIIFSKLQYLPITAIPVLWLVFILDYSDKKRYIKKSILYLLCLIPAITLILVFTNEYHNLIWQSTTLNANSIFPVLVNTYGWWFWIWVSYAYLLLILSIIMLLRIIFLSVVPNKIFVVFFIILNMVPLLANVSYLFKTKPILNLDLTPFLLTLSSILLIIGFRRTRFKDILLIAKKNIVESMTDGVLVTDIHFSIIYLNNAAKKIIGQKINTFKGCSMVKINPRFEEIIEQSRKEKNQYLGSSIEIGPVNNKNEIFEAIISPIKNKQSKIIGDIIVLRNITKLKKMHEIEVIRKSEERYKRLFENSLDGIYRSTISGKIVDANTSLIKMLGYNKKSELLSINMDDELYLSSKDKFSIGKTDKIAEVQLKDKNSNIVWAEISQRAFVDEYGRTYLEGIVRNITDRKIAEEKVRWLTFHDKLTGLYNRAYFEEELLRLDTARQLPLGVMLGDLNDLKFVNDHHGHQKGDFLLKRIADILKKTCRNEDVIARWGGDEFVILLPKTNEADVLKVIERIRGNISKENRSKFKLSLALGFSVKNKIEEDINEIMREAEKMMYKDKSNIKSRIEQQMIFKI